MKPAGWRYREKSRGSNASWLLTTIPTFLKPEEIEVEPLYTSNINQLEIYAWLGYWGDKLPPIAIRNLKEILGSPKNHPTNSVPSSEE